MSQATEQVSDLTAQPENGLPGCVCEYIKESLRERLETLIAEHGGGEPGTNASFTNVILCVNKALEMFLDGMGPVVPRTRSATKRKRALRRGSVLVK